MEVEELKGNKVIHMQQHDLKLYKHMTKKERALLLTLEFLSQHGAASASQICKYINTLSKGNWQVSTTQLSSWLRRDKRFVAHKVRKQNIYRLVQRHHAHRMFVHKRKP